MRIEQMEAKLIDKTVEQREQILEKAQEKAKKINVDMKAEKKHIEEITNQSIQNVISGELRAVHDRIVGGAELQGRKIVLEARTEVIAKVFEKAAEEVKALVEGPGYNEYLIKLATESVSKLNEDCIVYANEKDAEYLTSIMEQLAVGVKVKIETSPVDIVGGVIVVNLNGTKTITNTLDARLKEAEARLTSEVAEKLGVI
jgi:vacuolar-type H+-ATPase subunit E/Vma4